MDLGKAISVTTGAFNETNPKNPSSNDKAFLEEQFKSAAQSSKGRALGISANSNAAFNQTNQRNDSSNDASFLQDEFEKAKTRFSAQRIEE